MIFDGNRICNPDRLTNYEHRICNPSPQPVFEYVPMALIPDRERAASLCWKFPNFVTAPAERPR